MTKKKSFSKLKLETSKCRKPYNAWKRLESSRRYRRAAARELCDVVTKKIVDEVLDGIVLNLSERYHDKSMSVQNRILRRIIEKRQAQANHRKNGRTEDLTSFRLAMTSTSRCMAIIKSKRFAA